MMRTIPNMVVASPSDPMETKVITQIASQYNGPLYLRLGKAGEKQIYPCYENLAIGDIHIYKESSSKNALFVTGSIMDYAVNFVQQHAIDTAIYSVPFVKPINTVQLGQIVSKHHNIIVLEEHQKSCGLGAAVIEQINDLYTDGLINVYPRIKRIAIDDKFYSVSGNQDYLRKCAGLVLTEDLF